MGMARSLNWSLVDEGIHTGDYLFISSRRRSADQEELCHKTTKADFVDMLKDRCDG